METGNNIRNKKLQEYMERKTPVNIIMSNGFQQRGMTLTGFDDSVITAVSGNGSEKVMYHNAISTVEPSYCYQQHWTNAAWAGNQTGRRAGDFIPAEN